MNALDKTVRSVVGVFTLLVFFVAAVFLCLWIRTARDMKQTSLFLAAHHNESELQAAYRQPTTLYKRYVDVPEYYRRGVDAYTNCEFHVYQREGMPYWFFVVAVDSEKRVVEHGVVRKLGK